MVTISTNHLIAFHFRNGLKNLREKYEECSFCYGHLMSGIRVIKWNLSSSSDGNIAIERKRT